MAAASSHRGIKVSANGRVRAGLRLWGDEGGGGRRKGTMIKMVKKRLGVINLKPQEYATKGA